MPALPVIFAFLYSSIQDELIRLVYIWIGGQFFYGTPPGLNNVICVIYRSPQKNSLLDSSRRKQKLKLGFQGGVYVPKHIVSLKEQLRGIR